MIDFEFKKKRDEIRGKALKKISYGLKTEKEISTYLHELGYDEELIEDTISFLKEYKYVDDIYYSICFFKREKLKFKGTKRIEQELVRKGVSKDIIESAKNELEDETEEKVLSDIELARKLMDKMIKEQLGFGKALDDKFKGRVLRRLISKGFDNSICYKILGELNERIW